MSPKLEALLKAAEQVGVDEAIRLLESEQVRRSLHEHDVITIVGNRGAHNLPSEIARGYVYYASEGVLDFSTKQAVEAELTRIIASLAKVLKSKQWKKVYLVPFGHALINAAAKLTVYRVCHQETIDLFYHKDGTYSDINISTREIVGST